MVSNSTLVKARVNAIGARHNTEAKHGKGSKTPGKVLDFKREEIAKDVLHGGMSYKKAAKKHKVNKNTVELWVNRVRSMGEA